MKLAGSFKRWKFEFSNSTAYATTTHFDDARSTHAVLLVRLLRERLHRLRDGVDVLHAGAVACQL